ncbi:MAG: hypothetical protein KJ072_27010 [Verrucomicrobia bacterium]|nr:hypothetical protein [Verrucomicrobiota bacterium]
MLNFTFVRAGLLSLTLLAGLRAEESLMIQARQLVSPGLPPGLAREVLPATGALVHLQIHDVLSVLEGVEEIVVSGVPEKLLPPDAQDLLRSEHPLLTLLGMQAFQQPLTPELFAQLSGLDPRGTATLTLYLGDPRRMFILSLPARSREPLANVLSAALRPSRIEEIDLNGRPALRIASTQIAFAPEIYLLGSEDAVYLCGDRSLAIALFDTPSAQRLTSDGFMQRALPQNEDCQIRLVLNPAALKPFALQLQTLRGIAGIILPMQRQQLLANLPPEAREQLEMQVQSQLGVRDLEQFADYAECVLLASLEQFTDFVSSNATAFEGLTVAANLKGRFNKATVKVYSQKSTDGQGTAPVPLEEIRQALAWLGPEYQSFHVTGRKPEPKDRPVLNAWIQRVQSKLVAKGLDSIGLDRLVKLLEERTAIPTLESRVPWTLTVQAPLRPLPNLETAPSLEEYFATLDLPVCRPVQLVAGKDQAFLASCFRAETEALNRNRQLTMDFFDSFQKQRPLFDRINRFDAAPLDHGVTRYVRESAWITRGGLFGYDQHELVNRKIVWARQLDHYLVFHRGATASPWLANLDQARPRGIAPGVNRLLDRVPNGSSDIRVNRVLAGLPDLIDWVDALERRLHRDAADYVTHAQQTLDNAPDLDQAKHKIRGLRMPLLVGSVHLDPATRKVYTLLPAGEAALTLPRARVVPLLRELLAGYAAQANEVGGSVTYSRTGGGAWEFTTLQSWEALATLTRTFGNSLAEQYLSSPSGLDTLQQKLAAPRDLDPTVFDEAIARNPNWRFLPMPPARTPAKLTKPVAERSPEADARLVDLTAHYNGALDETWHQGGLNNNHLADLPTGLQTFDGIPFDVRGIVQIAGVQAARELRVKFPSEVNGIAVGQRAQRIHCLHACGWPSPQGTTIGSIVLHFANGETREIPIVYGRDVQDWWMNEPVAADSGLHVVWQGQNHASPSGPPVGLYRSTWDNPLPDQEIASIDYRSAMANSAPFLIAITLD